MMIEQTVEIPADGWIHLDVPPEWVGASGKVVISTLFPAMVIREIEAVELTKKLPPSPKDEARVKFRAARQKLRELCKDSKLTVDGFLAMKHADRVLETAIDKHLSVGIKSL
jgi:hypothetical protein